MYLCMYVYVCVYMCIYVYICISGCQENTEFAVIKTITENRTSIACKMWVIQENIVDAIDHIGDMVIRTFIAIYRRAL